MKQTRTPTRGQKRLTKWVEIAKHLYGPDTTLNSKITEELKKINTSNSGDIVIPGLLDTAMILQSVGEKDLADQAANIVDGSYWTTQNNERARRPTALPTSVLTSPSLPISKKISDITAQAALLFAEHTHSRYQRPTNSWIPPIDTAIRNHKIPAEALLFIANWVLNQDGQGPYYQAASAVTGTYGLTAIAPVIANNPAAQRAAEAQGILLPRIWPQRELNKRPSLTHQAHHADTHETWGNTRNVAF